MGGFRNPKGIFAISFLVSTTMAGGGVLTSLRAESSQEAAQKLMTLILIPAMVAQIGPLLFMNQISTLLRSVDWMVVIYSLLIAFAVADVFLLVLAFSRFQRSKMYLD